MPADLKSTYQNQTDAIVTHSTPRVMHISHPEPLPLSDRINLIPPYNIRPKSPRIFPDQPPEPQLQQCVPQSPPQSLLPLRLSSFTPSCKTLSPDRTSPSMPYSPRFSVPKSQSRSSQSKPLVPLQNDAESERTSIQIFPPATSPSPS